MQHRIKKLSNLVWRAILSPRTVVAFKVGGLMLQALHEIEAFRRGGHKGGRVGFKVPGEDE